MEKHLFIQYWSIAPAVKLFQHNLVNVTIVYGCATNPTYLKMATDFKIKMIQQLFRSLNNRKNVHTDGSDVVLRIWDCGGQQVFLDILHCSLHAQYLFKYLMPQSL